MPFSYCDTHAESMRDTKSSLGWYVFSAYYLFLSSVLFSFVCHPLAYFDRDVPGIFFVP